MITTIKHIYSGKTAQDYYNNLEHYLSYDALGLWQIAAEGKHDFQLNNTQLKEFIRSSVSILVKIGSNISIADAYEEALSEKIESKDADEIASAIYEAWNLYGADAIDIWFSKE